MNDPYAVLGVTSQASDDEVKRAYRDMVRKYHPDAYKDNPLADLAEEKMKEINEAHDLILKLRSGGGSGASAGGSGGGGSRGGSSNPLYQQVRATMTAGEFSRAEELLKQATKEDAEYFFLRGSIAYHKGWLDEAFQNIKKAHLMEPNNIEYRSALMVLQRNQSPFGTSMVQPRFCCCPCDCCTSLICLDCLCNGCC